MRLSSLARILSLVTIYHNVPSLFIVFKGLQKLHELSFIPLERTRVEGCVRAAQQLHPAVQDRVQAR